METSCIREAVKISLTGGEAKNKSVCLTYLETRSENSKRNDGRMKNFYTSYLNVITGVK